MLIVYYVDYFLHAVSCQHIDVHARTNTRTLKPMTKNGHIKGDEVNSKKQKCFNTTNIVNSFFFFNFGTSIMKCVFVAVLLFLVWHKER